MTTTPPSSPQTDQPHQKEEFTNNGKAYSLNPGKVIRTKFGIFMDACVKWKWFKCQKGGMTPWVVCLVHVSIFENQWLVPMI